MQLGEMVGALVDKLEAWFVALGAMIPNLVVALLLFTVSIYVARLAEKVVARGLGRVVHPIELAMLGAKLARLGLVVGGLFVALSVLELDRAVTSMLAGVGLVGLALGFAFQDIAANFVSGVLMAFRRPFKVGDQVRTSGFFGRVEEINLRTTQLRQLSGELVMIPNKDVFGQALENFTESPDRRVEVEVGVHYDDDLLLVRETTRKALEGLSMRNGGRDVDVLFTGFGDSSIDLVARFWIEEADQLSFLQARSEAVIAIKAAYDEAGITIPFPIRTLDLGLGAEAMGAADPLE